MSHQPPGAFRQLFSLLRPYWPTVTVATLLGMLGGVSITALLATINTGLHSEGGLQQGVVLAFIGLCVVALLSSICSDIGTNYVGQHVIAGLRKRLGEQVLGAPIEQIEQYRTHRLIPVLTHDVDTVSDFAYAFAPLAISLTVTLGCLGYLAYLSLPMFALVLLAIGLGTVIQYAARARGIRGFMAARDAEDQLQKHYQAIAEGAKELRIHRARRQRMLNRGIRDTADGIRDTQVRSINTFVVAKSLGSMLFFMVIGLALTLQSLWPQGDKTAISGFVLVLLYMKGPLEHLIVTLPIISKAQIALRRIAELSERFSSPEPHLLLEHAPPTTEQALHSLELVEVSYTYPPSPGVEPFSVGPVSFKVTPGQILFIVGGNGCGKTTLIKLLLGLYEPHRGHIAVNGEPIVASTRDDYRQLFTTVFADYYLFDEVISGERSAPQDAERYLARLELDHKVQLRDGAFSTTDLSTGQRKRLALLNAWLEGRPVLVFDEWAADQDPTFRGIFYTELLPDLKRLGKTIIVISHDDRYFPYADQLLRLERGRVVDAPQPA